MAGRGTGPQAQFQAGSFYRMPLRTFYDVTEGTGRKRGLQRVYLRAIECCIMSCFVVNYEECKEAPHVTQSVGFVI